MKAEELVALLQEESTFCWALPQKLPPSLLGEPCHYTHKHIGQCHSNYACDEMQKLRQLLSCWLTFVGAFRADAFLRLYKAEHHTANKHTALIKVGSLQSQITITL